ncbi:dTDP-glucose 4,6-dehydratase [Streptomyces sp. NPDC007929]|uniref:dTDP-glucose 4,6-dehydratase n=1 Tax=unclassified Streptomyces TaxID=2593676 RepID=UPI0036E24930
MAQQRILVTGGAGFIGSHYVRHLLGGGRGGGPLLTVLDKFTYAGHPAHLDPVRGHPSLRVVRGDIADAALVRRLLPGHDQVVHFAAETHVDRSIESADAFVRTNVLGTQTLLDAALATGVRTFLHISTDEVYGSVEHGASKEDAPLAPNSPYAASKAASDLLALAQHRTHGLDVRITRCSNNYGPRQLPEKLIPRFVTTLMEGGHVPLYGDGLHVRDWLHVDDHVRGIEAVRALGRPGEIYNIGGGMELTNRELTGRLLAACGAEWSRVRHVTDRKGHDRRYRVDWSKAHEELGYAPSRDFAQGLAETVAWYRDNPSYWT